MYIQFFALNKGGGELLLSSSLSDGQGIGREML